MAFRRGAKAHHNNRPLSISTENIPNTNPSTSPTRPLLVPAGDHQEEEDDEETTMMMNEGQTPSASLVQNDMTGTGNSATGDLESSPYLNAATFEPTPEELQKLKASQKTWNAVIFGIGTGAAFFALASMSLYASGFIVFCFAFPLVLGPYMIGQRRYMNKFPTLRRLINRLRFQVNRLQVQNNKFAAENNRLETEINSLQQVEFRLHQICEKQGSSITEMQKLVKENGAIQKQMKKIQDAQELQKFLQMVLLSDSDGDFILSDEEMDRFTMKLQCYSVVDQERLKQALRLCSVTNVNGDLYKTQQQERDLEIVSAGALSGVQGWMV